MREFIRRKNIFKKRSIIPVFAYFSVILAGILTFMLFQFPNPDIANASDPTISLAPGQTIKLSVYYDNASKGNDFSGQGQIRILLDEKINYVPGYLKDTYQNQTFCVNDSSSGGVRSVQNLYNQNTTVIDYSPRSATVVAPSGICTSGNGLAGNTGTVNIPRAGEEFNISNQQTWRGRLEFFIQLKEEVLNTPYNLSIGDIIVPDLNSNSVAIQAKFSLGGVEFSNPKYRIMISGVVLSQSNVISSDCLNQPVTIGNTAVCGFQLTGGNSTDKNYLLPNDFKVQIQGARNFATKNNCTLSNGSNLLTCNIPTEGATSGNDKPVLMTLQGTTQTQARIDLVNQNSPNNNQSSGQVSSSQSSSSNEQNQLDLSKVNFLIPSENLKFDFAGSNRPIWSEADLKMDIDINKQISSCQVKFRKYGSNDWWIDGEISTNNKTCTAILSKDKQYTQKWDTQVLIVDTEGKTWGAYPTYSMENGPAGNTEIDAKIVVEQVV